jgi:hypothetical protein
LTELTRTAAELNQVISPVTKKEFVNPHDALIAGQPARWLTWLDILVKDSETIEAQRSQLPGFLAEHRGLEHLAGVPAGGTLVLVYDASNTVVADFALPYWSDQPRMAPPKPLPPKLVPPLRPDIVFDRPIRFVAVPDKFRFEKLQGDLKVGLSEELGARTKYFDVFKDSIGIIAGANTKGAIGTLPGTLASPAIADPILGIQAADTALRAQNVDVLRSQLLDPTIDPVKRKVLEGQLAIAEKDLAATIVKTVDYIASSGANIKPGSDAAKVLSLTSDSLGKVSTADALTDVSKGLNNLKARPGTSGDMTTVMTNLLSTRGIK